MRSMTGFATTSGTAGGVRLVVEIRSVNQRHLDVKMSLPREYGAWEADLRRMVARSVGRGRVELLVVRSADRGEGAISIQREAAARYVRALRALKREFKLSGDVDVALIAARHDVFRIAEKQLDPKAERRLVERLVDKALAAHVRERTREGTHLRRDMESRRRCLVRIRRAMGRVAVRIGPRLRQRLRDRVEEAIGRELIDPSRLVPEVALYVDRADVTEELVRLDSHLESLRSLLDCDEPVGKRIDFLLQEIHREVNTVGSKAADVELTELVLEAKAEVEKLREQVQNVE